MSYRKVDQRTWNDEKFQSLPRLGKLVFLLVLTHPNMTALGAMRATVHGLAEELGPDPGEDPEEFRKGFQEAFQVVSEKGMVEYDPRAHLISLPNFLKYNRPESPNVIKSWIWGAGQLPECDAKIRVIVRAQEFVEDMSEAFRNTFQKAFPEVSRNQQQQQQPKQSKNPILPIHPKVIEGGKEGGRGTSSLCSSRAELHTLFVAEGVTGSLAHSAVSTPILSDEEVSEVVKGFPALMIERKRHGADFPAAALAGRCSKEFIREDLLWLRARGPKQGWKVSSRPVTASPQISLIAGDDKRLESLSEVYLAAAGLRLEPDWWPKVTIVGDCVFCPVEAWVAEDLATAAANLGLSVEFAPDTNIS